MWPWDEDHRDDALLRWHHWLLAIVMLIVLSALMPIFAAFS